LFNIRFKKEDYTPYPTNTYVDENDTAITSYHYVLLNKLSDPLIVERNNCEFILGNTKNDERKIKVVKKTFEEKFIEYPHKHNSISLALEKVLRKKYDEVYSENYTGYYTCIDLVVNHGNEIYFYEIKTYDSALTCIRQAIGQLIEYSYYPGKCIATKLFIVTPHHADNDTEAYIIYLRAKLKLPIFYIHFDEKESIIAQEI
jgi:hypothetical protein